MFIDCPQITPVLVHNIASLHVKLRVRLGAQSREFPGNAATIQNFRLHIVLLQALMDGNAVCMGLPKHP